MNNFDELYGDKGLMVELISSGTFDDNGNLAFTDRGKAIIKEIADYARSRPMDEKTKELREEYISRGLTASEVWCDMLMKVTDAPFAIYRDMTVMLLMPILDELVNGKESVSDDNRKSKETA